MDGIHISPLDPEAATDAELTEVHDLRAAVHAAALPHVPYQPVALSLAEYRRVTPEVRRRWWVARRAGEVVGWGGASWDDIPENRNHAFVNAVVAEPARRGGAGSDLVRLGLDAAAGWGADLIDLCALDGEAAGGFLERLGAQRRLVERISTCPTAELDRPLLEGWVGRAGERATGYSLVAWDGPCPEAQLRAFCELMRVMNTAPLDDLELDDEVPTPERVRQHEAMLAGQGYERWTICARHDDSGELAGYTDVWFPSLWPEQAYQNDTGVWPKHRERGLGRWLKAAMALRILDERPEVVRIETGNAASNDAMLAINVAMGFAPTEHWANWQVPLDRAREALARQ